MYARSGLSKWFALALVGLGGTSVEFAVSFADIRHEEVAKYGAEELLNGLDIADNLGPNGLSRVCKVLCSRSI